MATLEVEGGGRLSGEIRISGAKNAATPILAATLLTSDECIINNVPEITDVDKMLELLRELGATVTQDGHTVRVKAGSIKPKSLSLKLIKAMRSSLLLFGPLLARLGQVELPEPGGCFIGNRPLDAHLMAFSQLGVETQVEQREAEGNIYKLSAKSLQGAHVVLPEFSVTATENLLMLAVLTPGITVIDIAAAEPHVQDLCNFLVKMGAKISGIGTHHLVIDGVKSLSGVTHSLISDTTEAGTWAVLGAVCKGTLSIGPVNPEYLDIVLLKLREVGVDFEVRGDNLIVHASRQLRPFVKLQALPYPGFPTELQAPFSVLATQANGASLIQDPLYEGRLNHISELVKMGANAVIADPHRVVITGPTPLYGREIRSFDLRAGATLVIAALIAEGTTTITDAEIIDRGYEHVAERLQAIGAQVKRHN